MREKKVSLSGGPISLAIKRKSLLCNIYFMLQTFKTITIDFFLFSIL